MWNYVPASKLPQWPFMSKVKLSDIPKIKKFCVSSHGKGRNMFAITMDDRVLAAGANRFGQLGIGHKNPVDGVIEIRGLRGKQVVDIICSSVRCFALTKYGQLLAWGFNSEGMFGDAQVDTFVLRPEEIYLSGIAAIRSGVEMVAALTFDGRVIIWGELELGSRVLSLPQSMALPSGEIAVAIEGASYSFYVLTQNGRVFAFGSINGRHHRLRKYQSLFQTTLSEVLIPENEARVKAIACDYVHSIFITETGRAYVWGQQISLQPLANAVDGAKYDRVFFVGNRDDETPYTPNYNPESFFILTDTKGLCYIAGRHNELTEREYIIDPNGVELVGLSFPETILALSTESKISVPIMLSCQVSMNTFQSLSNLCINVDNSISYVQPSKLRQWPLVNRIYQDTLDKVKKFCILQAQLMYAITTDDRVLAAGINDKGQLGIGNKRKTPGFVEIKKLHGKQVIDIVSYCCEVIFALTRAGEVWTWGSTEDGLSGSNEDTEYLLEPVKIDIPNTVALRCGADTNIALTKDGHIYYWGEQQCDEFIIQDTPRLIDLPPGETGVDIEAGRDHFWVLTQSGRALGFGNNIVGQLGNTDYDFIESDLPAEVFLPIKGEKIKAMVCDYYLSFFVTNTGRLYVCGYGITECDQKLRLLYPGDEDIRFDRVLFVHGGDTNVENMIFLITTNGQCFFANSRKLYEASNITFALFTQVSSDFLFPETLLRYAPIINTPMMFTCQVQCANLQETSLVSFVHRPITLKNCLMEFEWARILNVLSIKQASSDFIYNNFQSINWTEEWTDTRKYFLEKYPDANQRRAPKRKATWRRTN